MMTKPPGWKDEPLRHGLAARGIKTVYRSRGIDRSFDMRITTPSKLPNDFLIGKTIKTIRYMTSDEMDREDWDRTQEAIAVVFEDGTIIYPSGDWEGNTPGVLFGMTKDGAMFCVVASNTKGRR